MVVPSAREVSFRPLSCRRALHLVSDRTQCISMLVQALCWPSEASPRHNRRRHRRLVHHPNPMPAASLHSLQFAPSHSSKTSNKRWRHRATNARRSTGIPATLPRPSGSCRRRSSRSRRGGARRPRSQGHGASPGGRVGRRPAARGGADARRQRPRAQPGGLEEELRHLWRWSVGCRGRRAGVQPGRAGRGGTEQALLVVIVFWCC